MLSLMCSLHSDEGCIPENRADLYEKCAMLLYERWDRSRGIRTGFSYRSQLKPALMHLAHWVYTTDQQQKGVKEDVFVEKTALFLNEAFYDPTAARRAAEDLVLFCRDRAWILTAVGHDRYAFTHRTFLSIYRPLSGVDLPVASRPSRRSSGPYPAFGMGHGGAAFISSKILDVVNASDELLDIMLAWHQQTPAELSALAFAARCLNFLIPSYRLIRQISESSIGVWLGTSTSDGAFVQPRRFKTTSPAIVGTLANAAQENRQRLLECVGSAALSFRLSSCTGMLAVANSQSTQRRVRSGASPLVLEEGLLPAEPVRTPDSSLGEAFSWPMRDPEWLSKVPAHGPHRPYPDRGLAAAARLDAFSPR